MFFLFSSRAGLGGSLLISTVLTLLLLLACGPEQRAAKLLMCNDYGNRIPYGDRGSCSLTRIAASRRPIMILRRDPAQVARMRGIVIGAAAMQRAAIVPHHQIAGVPSVAVNELALRRVLHQ